jgi:hypothetical protein
MRRSAVRTFERRRAAVGGDVDRRAQTESIYRRYAIVDEAMHREAAARLDAYGGTPAPPSKTGTVSTFTTKAV